MKINKIIVIDDEPEIVEIFSVFLVSKGFEVDSFTSGEDGLAALKKNNYDLVLTDKKMPFVSGMEIIKYVEEYSPDSIIFMITGDEGTTVLFNNKKSQVLTKPISLIDLGMEIDKL